MNPQQPSNEKLKELIKAINEYMPQQEGGFTGAVFFHHDKNGDLKTFSPLFGELNNKKLTLSQQMVERMLIYSNACKGFAEDLIRKSLPQS